MLKTSDVVVAQVEDIQSKTFDLRAENQALKDRDLKIFEELKKSITAKIGECVGPK